MAQIASLSAKSAEASRLRVRKHALMRQFGLPETLIGGSLVVSRRACGKPNCHCARGTGHPQWSITGSYRGKKRVERIDPAWAAELEQAVLATRAYMDAIKEVMAINLALLAMTRAQTKARTRRRKNATNARRIDQQNAALIDPLTM